MTREQVDAIIKTYEAGATGSAIARTLGVGQSSVYYHLEKTGIVRRPSGTPKLTPEQRADIIHTHSSGTSMGALARRYCVSRAAIWKVVHGFTGKRAREQRKVAA